MNNQTLKEYFKDNWYLEIYLTENFHIFIDTNDMQNICIELCDKNGNSKNINCDVDISINSLISDIKESVLNYIIGECIYE